MLREKLLRQYNLTLHQRLSVKNSFFMRKYVPAQCTKIYNTFTGKKEMAIDILDEYVCFEKIKDAL